MNEQTAVVPIHHKASLVQKFAAKYSLEPEKLLSVLKATAFKVKDGEATNEQMAALLVVADQYGLNPFTKEIFAFPDKGGIVPVVGVDGWSRIINDHPQSDGFEFVESPETVEHAGKKVATWMEVVIHRKDRAHPIKVREHFDEVKRDTQPWKSHPNRMLRHKTLIQGARVAYGFAGIYDEDEAERIIDMGNAEVVAPVRRITPAGGVWDSMTAEQKAKLEDAVDRARTAYNLKGAEEAAAVWDEEIKVLDADEQVAGWTRFPSDERSAMKRVNEPNPKARHAA